MAMIWTLETMYTSHLTNFNEFDCSVPTCLEASKRLKKYVFETEEYVL